VTGDEQRHATGDGQRGATGDGQRGATGDGQRRATGEGQRSATGDRSSAETGADRVRLTAWVSGRVQGVGFRWWTRSQALRLSLVGSASNLADGRVEVVAEGSRDNCERLAKLLESPDTPGQVDHVATRYDEPRGGLTGFRER
jgi:acylphosphatase